jgi:hypothetical protein
VVPVAELLRWSRFLSVSLTPRCIFFAEARRLCCSKRVQRGIIGNQRFEITGHVHESRLTGGHKIS